MGRCPLRASCQRQSGRLWNLIRRRNRKRARQLESIAARTGTLYPKDFWPELSLLAVWMGGSVGVYLPRLKEYYGETALATTVCRPAKDA